MNRLHDVAQLLVSCMRLASEQARIPTSHGLLDRALKTAIDKGAFPEWARESLHFADSRIGLRCVELPAILKWMQRAELTEVPNPSYQFTQFQVSDHVARYLLRRLRIDEDDAVGWGRALIDGIAQEVEDAEAVETVDA